MGGGRGVTGMKHENNEHKKELLDNKNLYSHFFVKFTFICNCAFFKKKKLYSFTIQNKH